MKLSIITINYNNLEGLRKTINSVIAQTWKDYEWIIIDGGSTDGSTELIEQYQTHFSYWCHEKDGGVFNAMNKGIAKAKGDYLNFLNSGDCYHEETTLEQVFKQMARQQAQVFYGDYYETFADGHVVKRFMPLQLDIQFLMHMPINHQSTLIQRELLYTTGYDETYHIVSDWKSFMQWLMNGVTFCHLELFIADFDMSGINQTMEEKKKVELARMFQEIIPPGVRLVIDKYEDYLQYPTLLRALRLFKSNIIYFSVISRIVKCLYAWDGLFNRHDRLCNSTRYRFLPNE